MTSPNSGMAPQSMSAPAAGSRAPLQGGVEQSGLQGGAQGNALQGGTQGNGLQGGAQNSTLYGGAAGAGWQGNQQRAAIDQRTGAPLQGSAQQTPLMGGAQNDPDVGNQQLLIDWDRWRNNLKESIERNTLANINVHNDVHFVWDQRAQMMVSRYPNGISTFYRIDVLPNRRIINITLMQSSHYPSFDQAVFDAISQLQGSSTLVYPPGSRRQTVQQESYVSTAATTQIQDVRFGDVESQRR
ncbi:MAG TPA: hypothetical protein V6C69_15745 [Trichormus sp.]